MLISPNRTEVSYMFYITRTIISMLAVVSAVLALSPISSAYVEKTLPDGSTISVDVSWEGREAHGTHQATGVLAQGDLWISVDGSPWEHVDFCLIPDSDTSPTICTTRSGTIGCGGSGRVARARTTVDLEPDEWVEETADKPCGGGG